MRDPILADRRVRHAIGYAIDRDAIIRYMRRGLARPARPDSSRTRPGHSSPPFIASRYDPELAMSLLDEAGYRDPDGDGPLPRLRLSLKISSNEEMRLQSTVVQQNLRRVGIDLDLRSYEFATLLRRCPEGQLPDVFADLDGGSVADPDILRRVFHSDQTPPLGFNRGYYSNAEVDRLIDLATQSTGEADRARYYRAAQILVADDAPYIPIWNRTNVIVAQRSLDGLHVNPIGDFQALKDVKRTSTPP